MQPVWDPQPVVGHLHTGPNFCSLQTWGHHGSERSHSLDPRAILTSHIYPPEAKVTTSMANTFTILDRSLSTHTLTLHWSCSHPIMQVSTSAVSFKHYGPPPLGQVAPCQNLVLPPHGTTQSYPHALRSALYALSRSPFQPNFSRHSYQCHPMVTQAHLSPLWERSTDHTHLPVVLGLSVGLLLPSP